MSILHATGVPLRTPSSHHSLSHRRESLTDLLQVICQIELVSNAPLFQFYTHIWKHPHWFIGTQSVLPEFPPRAGIGDARSWDSHGRLTALQLEGAKTLQTALTHYVLQVAPNGQRDALWADTVRVAASDICARLLATNEGGVPVVEPLQAVVQSPQLFAFLSSDAVYLLKAPRSLRKALWERKLPFASVFGHSTDTSPAVNVSHDDLASLSDARANFPGCVRWKTLMDANAGLGERGRRVLHKLRDVLFLRGQHEVNAFLRLLYQELQATDLREGLRKRSGGMPPAGTPSMLSSSSGGTRSGPKRSDSGGPATTEAERTIRVNDGDSDHQAIRFKTPEPSFLDPGTITSILANFGFQNGRLTTPRLVWNAALANGTRSIRLDCQLTPFAYARFFEGASQLAAGHTLWLRCVPSEETWEAWGPLLGNTSEQLLKDLESGCPEAALWLDRHLPLQPTAVALRGSGKRFHLADGNLKKALPAPVHNAAVLGPGFAERQGADLPRSNANPCGDDTPSLGNDGLDNSNAGQCRRQAMLTARKAMMMARRQQQQQQQGGGRPLYSSSGPSSSGSEDRNEPSAVALCKGHGTGPQCVGPAPSLMGRNQRMSGVPIRARETSVGVLASGRNNEEEKKPNPKVIHAVDLADRGMRSLGEGRQRQALLREVRPIFRKAIMLLDKNVVICFVGPFPFAPLTPAIQIGDLPQLNPRIMDDLVDYFVVSSSITAKTYDTIADYLNPKKLRSLFWLCVALNRQQESAEGKTTVAQLSATTMFSSIPATSPLVARVQPAFRLKSHDPTVTDCCTPPEGRTRFSRNVFFLVPDHFIADLVSPMVSDPQTRILLAAANARPLQQRLLQMRDKQRLWENAARQQLAATVEALRCGERKKPKIMNNHGGNTDDMKEEIHSGVSTSNDGDIRLLELLLSQAPNFFVHLICVLPWYRRKGEPLVAEKGACFVRPNWDLKALAALRGAFEYRDSRSALLDLENESNVRSPPQSRLLVWFVPLNYVEECYETTDITTMTEALCRHQLPGHVISTLFSDPREPLCARIPRCLPEPAANCRHYASFSTDGPLSVKRKAGCLHPTSPAASTTTTASSQGGVSCATPEHRATDAVTIEQPPPNCEEPKPESGDNCRPSSKYLRQEAALNGKEPATQDINDQEEPKLATTHNEGGSVLVSPLGVTKPVTLSAKPQLRESPSSPIRNTSLISLKPVSPTIHEGLRNAGRCSGRKRRRVSGVHIVSSATVGDNSTSSSPGNGERPAQRQPSIDNQNPCNEERDAPASCASKTRHGKLRPVRQHSANTLYARDFLWY